MLFPNDEKRHFLCSDDDVIWHGPKDIQGEFINDIKMSVRWSVRPSDEKKMNKSAEEVVASYVPPRYLLDSRSSLNGYEYNTRHMFCPKKISFPALIWQHRVDKEWNLRTLVS